MNNFFSRKAVSAFLFASVLLSVMAFGLFSSSGRDDVYITYWASHALSQWGEIVNYNGISVEQSSSLLHTVLLSFVYSLTGIKLHILGPVLSLGFAFLTFWQTYRLGSCWSREVGIFSILILSTSTYFVYWSISGLEGTLMAFLSISLVYYGMKYFAGEKRWQSTAILFVTLLGFILIRPENLLVVFSILLGFAAIFLLLHFGGQNKLSREAGRLFLLSALSLAAVLFMLLFRYGYFGDLFPEPVNAKLSGPGLSAVVDGYHYLWRNFSFSLWKLKFLIILAGSGYVFRELYVPEKVVVNRYFFAAAGALLFVVSYLSFIILTGGDWMEGGRFIVPLLPFISLLLAYSISLLPLGSRPKIVSVLLVMVLQIGITVRFAAGKSTGMPVNRGIQHYRNYDDDLRIKDYSWFELTNRIHLRDIPMIYRLEKTVAGVVKAKEGKVHILTQQMGMIPYFLALDYYGEIEFTDLRGLTDKKLLKCQDDFDIDKSNSGLDVRLDGYLEKMKQYRDACSIEPPDIIYSLGNSSRLGAAGLKKYAVIYEQWGFVNSGSVSFRGKEVDGSMFIAVRKGLVNERGIFKPKITYLRYLMP